MRLVRMTTGRSKNRVFFVRTIGDMIAVIPRMRNIFAIFDPRTFPIAISVFQEILAMIETMSSGILVPIATIVRPMIASEIRYFFAIETAPSTRVLPPYVRSTSPAMIKKSDISTSIKEC